MADIQTLKSWFETGDFPSDVQFKALIDSLMHRTDGGKLALSRVEGLEELLNGIATQEQLQELEDSLSTVSGGGAYNANYIYFDEDSNIETPQKGFPSLPFSDWEDVKPILTNNDKVVFKKLTQLDGEELTPTAGTYVFEAFDEKSVIECLGSTPMFNASNWDIDDTGVVKVVGGGVLDVTNIPMVPVFHFDHIGQNISAVLDINFSKIIGGKSILAYFENCSGKVDLGDYHVDAISSSTPLIVSSSVNQDSDTKELIFSGDIKITSDAMTHQAIQIDDSGDYFVELKDYTVVRTKNTPSTCSELLRAYGHFHLNNVSLSDVDNTSSAELSVYANYDGELKIKVSGVNIFDKGIENDHTNGTIAYEGYGILIAGGEVVYDGRNKGYINPLHFGAVNSDSVDSSPAFQIAANLAEMEGKTLLIPAGKYLLSSTVTANFSKLKVKGEGMYKSILIPDPNSTWDEYGFLSCRGTDINNTIQDIEITDIGIEMPGYDPDLFEAAPTSWVDTKFVSGVNFSNIYAYTDGKAAANWNRNESGFNSSFFNVHVDTVNNIAHNQAIDGVMVDFCRAFNAAEPFDNQFGTKNITISNIYCSANEKVTDVTINNEAIDLGSGVNVTISNVIATGPYDYGVFLKVENNKLWENVSITDCQFLGYRIAGIRGKGKSTVDTLVKDVIITDNIMKSSYADSDGISMLFEGTVTTRKNLKIVNNTITADRYGINLGTDPAEPSICEKIKIHDNEITVNTAGIRLYNDSAGLMKGVSVKDNEIELNKNTGLDEDGILCRYVENLKLKDNTVTGGRMGLQVTNCYKPRVSWNTISGCYLNGIYMFWSDIDTLADPINKIIGGKIVNNEVFNCCEGSSNPFYIYVRISAASVDDYYILNIIDNIAYSNDGWSVDASARAVVVAATGINRLRGYIIKNNNSYNLPLPNSYSGLVGGIISDNIGD